MAQKNQWNGRIVTLSHSMLLETHTHMHASTHNDSPKKALHQKIKIEDARVPTPYSTPDELGVYIWCEPISVSGVAVYIHQFYPYFRFARRFMERAGNGRGEGSESARGIRGSGGGTAAPTTKSERKGDKKPSTNEEKWKRWYVSRKEFQFNCNQKQQQEQQNLWLRSVFRSAV